MNSKNSKQLLVFLAIISLGFTAVYFLSGFIEQNRPPVPAGYEDEELVLQGARLKDYSLGLNGLIADWYWMQSLQYLGGKLAKKPDAKINVNDLSEFDPKLLYSLLNNAVSFDPQFMGVYEYGAVVLPAIDPNQAIKLINKGIENNPKEWKLFYHLGYIYWKSGFYEQAAIAYERGAEIEGASPLMRSMAAKMKNDGGSRETARTIYRQIYESANDTQTKKNAELHLLKLDSQDEMDAVNLILQDFRQKNSRCATGIPEIFPFLSKVKLPGGKDFQIDKDNNLVDPGGAPYLLNKEKCLIAPDKNKTSLPTD